MTEKEIVEQHSDGSCQMCYENGRWMELAGYCLQQQTLILGFLNLVVVCRRNGNYYVVIELKWWSIIMHWFVSFIVERC